jgi:alanine-synthesizing transaminase
MKTLKKSNKLENVCYDIRGPVLKEAKRLEDDGHSIIKLNIGNPAAFGFDAPEEIIQDVISNLPNAAGYCDSKGIFSARKAVMQEYQERGITDVGLEDIYMGNGVSELISLATQGLINNGDEVLIPAPDYPLWTACTNLAGGKAVHYRCDPENEWQPDINDIASKITSKTVAIVIINPNNPTGALYNEDCLKQIVSLAEKHELVVFADEIYDKVLYDDAIHIPLSKLVKNTLCITFNGLSKAYRAAGFRSGWMMLSGDRSSSKDYIEGLDILTSMRLCANVPAQHAVQTALGGYQSIKDLLLPSGRLHRQRELAWKMLTDIPGVNCVKPKGALYLFPQLDPEVYEIKDDQAFALDLLLQEKVLIVQGSGFNWPETDHFRIVFLPNEDDLRESIGRIGNYLEKLRR